jgi:hypothetical protein
MDHATHKGMNPCFDHLSSQFTLQKFGFPKRNIGPPHLRFQSTRSPTRFLEVCWHTFNYIVLLENACVNHEVDVLERLLEMYPLWRFTKGKYQVLDDIILANQSSAVAQVLLRYRVLGGYESTPYQCALSQPSR